MNKLNRRRLMQGLAAGVPGAMLTQGLSQRAEGQRQSVRPLKKPAVSGPPVLWIVLHGMMGVYFDKSVTPNCLRVFIPDVKNHVYGWGPWGSEYVLTEQSYRLTTGVLGASTPTTLAATSTDAVLATSSVGVPLVNQARNQIQLPWPDASRFLRLRPTPPTGGSFFGSGVVNPTYLPVAYALGYLYDASKTAIFEYWDLSTSQWLPETKWNSSPQTGDIFHFWADPAFSISRSGPQMQHMNDVLKAFNALFNPALSITPGSSYPSASLAYSIPPTPQYPIPWNEQYSMREFKEKWALCGVKAYNEYYTD